MNEPGNGYEYLAALQNQGKKGSPNFGDLSEYLEGKARTKGIPIHGQFELTPLCNLDCKMCYVHLTSQQLQGSPLLTTAQWKDLMLQAFKGGMFQSTLTGGECLTYPGFEELYLYLQSLGCQVDVLTNAVWLDEEKIRFFKAHPPSLIQITLYGANEDAYERVTGKRVFHQVYDHIQLVKEARLPLSITVTPNPFLGEDVFDTIRTARSLTDQLLINTSLFVPRDEPWRMKGEKDLDVDFYVRIQRFYHELEGFRNQQVPEDELPAPGGPHHACDVCGLECGGGRSGFVITWKGEMCPCNRLEIRSYPLRDGFSKAWQIVNQAAENWPRVPECLECPYEQVCDKCAARMAQYAAPGHQPTALCRQTRYMVSQGIKPLSHCES